MSTIIELSKQTNRPHSVRMRSEGETFNDVTISYFDLIIAIYTEYEKRGWGIFLRIY